MILIRTVFNAETGEQIVEEVSPEETAQVLEMHNALLTEIEKQNLKEETEAALVESAREKLKALGLSDEEIVAIIGPGPVPAEDVVNLDPATEEPAVVDEPVAVEEPVADEAAE